MHICSNIKVDREHTLLHSHVAFAKRNFIVNKAHLQQFEGTIKQT